MATWPDNQFRYFTRLETFGWCCVNFHALMNVKPDGISPVVEFKPPYWGGIPENLRKDLTLSDLYNIQSVFEELFQWALRDGKHAIDADNILELLDWSFNPNDIEGLKVVYMTPKDPRKQPKKRKTR